MAVTARKNGCAATSPVPFTKGGPAGCRFFRDLCCSWVIVSIIVAVVLILPLASLNMPLVEFPKRTAVIHTSPTKEAVMEAADQNTLLHSLTIMFAAGGNSPSPAPTQAAKKPSGSSEGSLGGSMESGAPAAEGCRSDADKAIWKQKGRSSFSDYMNECGTTCQGGFDCVKTCIENKHPYSNNCVTCFADLTQCSKEKCLFQCMTDGTSKKCGKCVKKHCNSKFASCSGFPESDLPANGKHSGTLLNIEGALIHRRFRQHAQMLNYQRAQRNEPSIEEELFMSPPATQALITEGILDSMHEDAPLGLSQAISEAESGGSLDELEKAFANRPICKDDDEIISQATNGAVQSCQAVATLCDDAQFSAQLKLACPITCNAMSPKCKGCKNHPNILKQATNGKITTCAAASILCTDPKFGPHLLKTCPITCDACGVEFSTPPPTPAPVTKTEQQQATLLVLNKIQDGSLVEDSITEAIKVAFQNPQGPKDAVDAWGFMYAFVTLQSKSLTVDIQSSLLPLVFHRPVGHPFDFTQYEPYRSSLEKKDKKETDDDDGKRSLYDTNGYITTTVAHIEVPRMSLQGNAQNMATLGMSAHFTKSWIDMNRDILEWVGFPTGLKMADEKIAESGAPKAIADKFHQQLDISAMGRPTPPTTIMTFAGTVPVSASYSLLSASADFEVRCKAVLVPDELAKLEMPKVDCGTLGMGNVKNLSYAHNIGTIIGLGFVIAFVLVNLIWCSTRGSGVCCGSKNSASQDMMKALQKLQK